MSEHLKSNHTFEKVDAAIKAMPNIEEEGTTLDDVMKTMRIVTHIELEGIGDYAKQFTEFVNSFGIKELPYILAAMTHFVNIMLESMPKADRKDLRQEYEYCLEIINKFMCSTVVAVKRDAPNE